MSKKTPRMVKEIDDSFKEEIRTIDYTGTNIIEKDYMLVMDNSAISKYIELDVPMRSAEHRVVLIKKGSVDYQLNYVDYHVSAGELLLVPANYIIIVNDVSRDNSARVLSFRFADKDFAGLVGYDVVKLRLGMNEEQVFDNFYQMMNQVLNSPTTGKRDFEHLVLSMLFRIRGLNIAYNGDGANAIGDRKQAIFARFMQVVSTTDIAPRLVAYYADQVGVSESYLSIVVKEQSGRTIMEWVDVRTITQIKQLLLNSADLSIEQIAAQLHFSSTTQMIRLFKKLTGKTPLEYRREKMV